MADWFRTNRGWLVPSFVITSTIILLFSYTLHMQNEKREQSDEIVAGKVVSVPQPPKKPAPEHSGKHLEQTINQKTIAAPSQLQVKPINPPVAQKQPVPVTRNKIMAKAAPPTKVAPPAQVTLPVKATPPVQVLPKEKTASQLEKVTPEELIKELEGLTGKKLNAEEQKLLGRHVVWTVYLFSARKKGYDKFTVSFDSSKTGFGVVIVAEMDLLKYVNIVTSRQGDPIRIDGTITGIDVSGTGQINLDVNSIHSVNR